MKVLIFSGTEEGRSLAQWLTDKRVDIMVKVATEYGATVNGSDVNVSVGSCGGTEGIAKLIANGGFGIVIDATHPYASNITSHIREACERTDAEYVRVSRGGSEYYGVKTVDSVKNAVDYLTGREGRIFVSTGSKEAAEFARIPDFKDRVIMRILSVKQSIDSCMALGFEGKGLICAQGPFSKECNLAMFRDSGARYLVTKDSGSIGGFAEKYEAAKELGMEIILIARPQDDGHSLEDVVRMMSERLSVEPPALKRKISLIGIGMGGETMTQASLNRIREADLVIGARRMLESADTAGKTVLEEYAPSKISEYLDANPGFSRTAVLFSGDVGFHSGATKLGESLDRDKFDVEFVCGISSAIYFCSRIGETWQDMHMISNHGKEANIIGNVDRFHKVFSLLSGADDVVRICKELTEYGLNDVHLTIGCDLGSKDERIISGKPAEIDISSVGRLCVALIINDRPRGITHGIPDTEFIRGEAPMTKSEVRMLSVAKLRIDADSVIYDIGAGTGSVSVELAQSALDGMVYAVEMRPEAAELIEKNKRKFRTPNVQVVIGPAPEALSDLPEPTHAFIGGSSGNLKQIVQCLVKKNPDIRIVMNAVTLETVGETVSVIDELGLVEEEIISLSVNRARKAGRYHLMDSQNPVQISVVRGR